MTNKFYILWFEDETTWFTMESTKLKRELQKTYGFQTECKQESGNDFSPEELTSDNRYDLILMDYKLAAGNTGEKIVNLIRENAILTDVVLYSSQHKEMIDALKTNSPLIDGVFFADRKSELFENKVLPVINKIVRRSEDIVNLRGFFLDNTSDFEVRIKEIIKMAWDKLPNQRDLLQEAMSNALDESRRFASKNVEEIIKKEDIYNAANNNNYVISIHGRLKVLSVIIELLVSEKSLKISDRDSELKNFPIEYDKNITAFRNALGHKKYSDSSLNIRGNVINVDSELHKKLRETVARYDYLIKYIEDFITEI